MGHAGPRRGHLTAVCALAVFGAWLVVLPASVLTVPLRLRSWDPEGYALTLSVILAAGWLASALAFVVAGALSDRLHARGSRRPLPLLAVPALLAGAVALALAPGPVILGAVWILLQFPVAGLVVSAQAVAGDALAPARSGPTSAWIGTVPLAALLLGSLLVNPLQDAQVLAFLVPAVLGVLAGLPLCLTPSVYQLTPPTGEAPPTRLSIGAPSWRLFLIASFAVSTATAIINSYAVGFTETVSMIPVAEVAGTATTAIALASAMGIVGALLGGYLATSSARAASVYSSGALVLALGGVLMVAVPGWWSLLVGAAAVGLGFGSANGAELALALAVRRPGGSLAASLGVLAAVTTAPYVVVPAVGGLLLLADGRAAYTWMWALAVAGGLVAAWAARTVRSSLA